MRTRDSEIIGEKPCKCGCGGMVQLKRWTLHPSKTKTEYIRGHQQFGNKRGWKTGNLIQNGYVLVNSPNHPNKNAQGNGYVKRSRLVMEEHLGRYLSRDEHVHHLNEIRDDDRIENLVIMTRSEHIGLHHRKFPVDRDVSGKFVKKGGDAQCPTLQ